jgi:hypothetical protein
MEIYEQKVLRFDVDPIAFDPDIILLSEMISLKYEVSNSYIDCNVKLLTLIWKIHYTDMEDNEVLGLLITHDHLINIGELDIIKMKRTVLLSALHARQKIEDRISAHFLENSNFDNLDIKLYANKILLGVLSI